MANFSTNFAGSGNIVAESITSTGRITGAGFTSSINGSPGTPSFNWSSDPDSGLYHSGVANRYEAAAGGSDSISIRNTLVVNYRQVNQEADLVMGVGRSINLDANTSTTDAPLQFSGDPNTGIVYSAADQFRVLVGGAASMQFSNSLGVNSIQQMTFSERAIFSKELRLMEMTAPAGVTDAVVIYAVVDGGGKTDLTSIFQTGAAQVITQEP